MSSKSFKKLQSNFKKRVKESKVRKGRKRNRDLFESNLFESILSIWHSLGGPTTATGRAVPPPHLDWESARFLSKSGERPLAGREKLLCESDEEDEKLPDKASM